MARRRRSISGALVVSVAVFVLSGCGVLEQREADRVAKQEAQLDGFIEQADAWGAEIMAQVPEEETESVSHNLGGTRESRDDYVAWPKYYYWAQGVDLLPDGPRSPEEFADDLDPWLRSQGWERHEESEFPPGKESFTRDYSRDGYSLSVEVYTDLPPRAQTIDFSITTPRTDPDA